jgi:PKD repeat protein
MNLFAKLLAAGLLLLGAGGPHAADTDPPVVPHLHKGDFPRISLPERQANGPRAAALLGARLPEVAAWYRRSPDEFRAMLLNDRHLRVDRRGRLFVVDQMLPPAGARSTPAAAPVTIAGTGGAAASLLDGSLQPLDQTFQLHSRPGARRTIYLNFKGATLTGTAWNDTTGVATINALPFDLDGLPYSFSTTELQRIQYIWQRVAEDYAPFDVDVTTEAPAPAALTRTDSSDTVFGTTVLITSSRGVYSCNCGGIAYVGAFDDVGDYYKPALVFYDQIGPGDEKFVAEAISHEAGHNMGLSHDGSPVDGYYAGHGSGATGWAPIMGLGYYQPVVQWSRGEYAGADNTQDDFAVMQSYGLPLRADDHGDTMATATVLTGTSSGGLTSASVTGVIERSTDVDMFAFSAAAGPLTLTLSPASRSPNLDALVTLRNSAGAVITTANPVDALNATLAVTLPAAGTYYVAVQGTGRGDPRLDGYSSYGSVGQYALSVRFLTPGNLAPVARMVVAPASGQAPLVVRLSGSGSTDGDGSIASWNWTFGDDTIGTGTTTSHVYTRPGTYVAQLRVVDNGGLSATTSTTITVGTPPVAMSVASIAMSRVVSATGTAVALAGVQVLDAGGKVVPGATVTGNWSGIVSKTGVIGTTATATGVATFTSPTAAKTAKGAFTFTVTGVTRTGYGYVPAANLETSDTIAR